jgi:LacI family transcriptional regulator
MRLVLKNKMVDQDNKKDSGRFPSSADVARQAGVSRTAVSYVLNGVQTTHVSPEVRQKILQAAQELGYQINTSASSLRRGHSKEINMIVDSSLSSFTVEYLTAIQQHSLECGYTFAAYFSNNFTTEQYKDLYLKIFARRPLGILASPHHFTAEDVEIAQKMGIKYILFTSFQQEEIPGTYTIAFPSQSAGNLATQHLIDRGHRHLALVHPEDPIQEVAFQQRLKGMRQATDDASNVTIDIIHLRLSMISIQSTIQEYLSQPVHATGIYTFSDDYALPLINALTLQGFHIPKDIAIVGTDNLPLGEYTIPPLTSIRFDAIDMGKRAITMIDLLHRGLPLPEEYTRPLVPELVLRASS